MKKGMIQMLTNLEELADSIMHNRDRITIIHNTPDVITLEIIAILYCEQDDTLTVKTIQHVWMKPDTRDRLHTEHNFCVFLLKVTNRGCYYNKNV